jgi:predicted nucleotidyltransferase
MSDILVQLRKDQPALRRRYGVRRFGVFGSVAHGTATPTSDIDLLVEFDRPIGLFRFLELEQELTHRLGRTVDLVTKEALKDFIRAKVLRDVQYV